MNIGIIGTGFAARRIISILSKLNNNFEFNIYSNRKNIFNNKKKIKVYSLKKITKFKETFFFIANNTSEHFKYLKLLIKKNKNVYVEKPICSKKNEAMDLQKYLKKSNSKVVVGYQYRENLCIKYLKKIVKKERKKIISVFAYSGENVKFYHKKENYINSYSVSKKKGGGVVLTQSHQIDYLNYIFGKILLCRSLESDNSKKFKLKTNTENNVSYLLKTLDGILISANLNYFGRKKTFIQIEMLNKTIIWSNNDNSILISKNKIKKIIKFKQSREDMFRRRIKKFLSLSKISINDNDLFSTILLIDKIKKNYL
jgi:CMP-N,N'-diacetyllegionaminic acid synthase